MSEGKAKDRIKAIEKISAVRADYALQEVLDYIKAQAYTNDFFLGYSIIEAIQDRIDTIGSLPAAEDLYNKQTTKGKSRQLTRSPYGSPTKQASLLALKERGLAAIQAAKNTSLVFSETPIEENDEAVAIDDVGDFYIG